MRSMEMRMPAGYPAGRSSAWQPLTDVCEAPDHYLVEIEVAGLEAGSVEVAFGGDTVLVTGRRLPRHATGAIRCVERSIPVGRFGLRVRFPGPIESDGADMRYQDGFLLLRIPKRETGWA